MPFTFSHPALVLPLQLLPKKWFSLTALVIGSLMPDLEAFVRFSSQKAHSHTWAALFWFCLPAGLLLSLLYHQLVRNPLLKNLPPFFYKKMIRFTKFNWMQQLQQNGWVVALSFLIGGASHLLWDSFSHFDGLLPLLDPKLTGNTRLWGHQIEIPYLIQYFNSIIGLLVIAIVLLSLPAQKNIHTNRQWWHYWLLVLGISAAVFALRWWAKDSFKIDDLIVSLSTALMIGLTVTSAFYFKRSQQL